MKKRSLLVITLIALLFATCGKKGGVSGLQIPKDAAIVVHVNSASLSSKITWQEISQTNWFKAMSEKAEDSLARKILADPSASGIDTKQDFVLFMKKHGRGSYVVAEGSLTSEAAYQQMLAEMNKKEPKEVKKSGEFSYIVPDEKTVVLWNKSKFALVSNADMGHMPSKIPGVGGMMKNMGNDDESTRFETDSLLIFGQQALTAEGGNNLNSDDRFADLVKNGSDVHMWVNLEQMYSGAVNPLTQAVPTLNTDAVFKGNVAAISLNFENGKIAARTKHYMSEEMRKIAEKNKPQNVTAATLNRIPSSNVVMVSAFNYSPTGLKETLKALGIDGWADLGLGKLGFSLNEFVNANKGEVLFAVSDPVQSTGVDTSRSGGEGLIPFSKAKANILFASSVNDAAAFQKQVDLVTNLMGMVKQKFNKGGKGSDDSQGNALIPGVTYKIANNWFAVSNSTDHRDKFLAGGSTGNLPFADKITGHPVAFYIDIQKMQNWFGTAFGQKDVSEPSIWQDMIGKGGDFNGSYSEFEIEINLVDKNTNALKQLNQQADKDFLKNKEKMARWGNHEMMGMDSTQIPGMEKH